MKNLMKKFCRRSIWILSALIATSLLASCSKDDGPTRTDLLVGTWELEEVNGDRVRSTLNVEITIDRDGDYEEEIDDELEGFFVRFTGEWEWNRNEDEIIIEYDQNISDWELEVELLTSEELEVDDGDDTYLLTKK